MTIAHPFREIHVPKSLTWPAVLFPAVLGLLDAGSAAATPLPSNRNIDIRVSNVAGAMYGSGPNDTYYINAPGGGLGQLHISTDGSAAGVFGQVTTQTITTPWSSGSFYVTTTGGRGYNDDIVLLFSVTGAISDEFKLTVRSSGYRWTPSAAGVIDPIYKAGAVDETFTKAGFLYGPQTTKPGPGTGNTLPFYSGQDIHDPSTAQSLMFIDLNVGNTTNRSSIASGDAKVEYDITGLYGTTASFNAYAWAYSASVASNAINWTNRLSTNLADPGQSGLSITSTAQAVPEPGTLRLLGAGVIGVLVSKRRGKRSSL